MKDEASVGVCCPLCAGKHAARLDVLQSKDLLLDWRSAYGIDISSSLADCKSILLYECMECGLRFFDPPVEGTAALYEELEKCPWYYKTDKWEYRAALRDIPSGARVLEVGCGRGHFLQMLQSAGRASGCGVDFNSKAIASAQQQKLSVRCGGMEDVPADWGGPFDVVCAFQVLEHVPNPRVFLEQCVEQLRDGGRLLLSVPDAESFMRLDNDDLCSRPPHHVTVWREKVMRALPGLLPLRILRIRHEPLASYHLEWYVNLQLARLPWVRYVTGPIVIAMRRWGVPLLRMSRLYRLLRGHTLHASFVKVHTPGTEGGMRAVG